MVKVLYPVSYFGEMIADLGMTGPMVLFALIFWLRNPHNGNHAEVAVNRLGNRDGFTLGQFNCFVQFCVLTGVQAHQQIFVRKGLSNFSPGRAAVDGNQRLSIGKGPVIQMYDIIRFCKVQGFQRISHGQGIGSHRGDSMGDTLLFAGDGNGNRIGRQIRWRGDFSYLRQKKGQPEGCPFFALYCS